MDAVRAFNVHLPASDHAKLKAFKDEKHLSWSALVIEGAKALGYTEQ